MEKENKLVEVVNASDLPKPKVQALLETFSPALQEARDIIGLSGSIKVDDEKDVESMGKAREARLKLKNIRVDVEKTRKDLKEQSLREGRAIDGAANIIKALIVPAEEYLLSQEKYTELLEEKRLKERNDRRAEELSKYVEDIEVYNLLDMGEEAFQKLLSNSKEAHNAKIKAEKEAQEEQERIRQKEELYSKRSIELAPLSEFTDFVLTLDSTEESFEKALESARASKKKYEEEQERIRQENEKLQKEKEIMEAKLQKEREKEEQKKREEEEEKKRLEEEKRKAELAPDVDKLKKVADEILKIEIPIVSSQDATNIVTSLRLKLEEVSGWLKKEADNL